jgi:hypothetical protein
VADTSRASTTTLGGAVISRDTLTVNFSLARGRQTAQLIALILSASAGCSSSAGQDGGPCKSTGSLGLGGEYCDNGLVCIASSSGHDTCGHCTRTDPQTACDLLHACQGGVCVACPNGPNDCGAGDWARACADGGTCVTPLVCTPGGVCESPGAEMKVIADAAVD